MDCSECYLYLNWSLLAGQLTAHHNISDIIIALTLGSVVIVVLGRFPCVGETISVPGVVWSCCISNESWRCEVLQRHHQHLISFSQTRVVSSPSSTDREHFLLWRFSDGRQTVWTYHSEIVLTEFCRINSRNVGSVTRQAWPAGCHVTLDWAKHFYYNGWGELATSQSHVMS